MGFILVKVTQGVASVLILGFFGLAIFKFGQVIFRGFTKEKK